MFQSTLLVFFTVFSHSPVFAEFGQPLSHGIDSLFDVMGQTAIAEWDVDDGNVVLNIETEKVIGEDEIWVLDFQAYEMTNGSTPVDSSAPPNLVPGFTGSCSNIFANTPDFYKDTYDPSPPGTKDLYNAFTKGTPSGDRRFDNYTYTGDVDTLLKCTNTEAEKVWVHKVYEDYVEFNATLYMTNVRPKYINKPVAASYIESYVVLYWRLLRVALSRFLISSTERLRPLFQYAIVSTVYVNDDSSQEVDRSRAKVEMVFKTVTDSDGELISVYRFGSLDYTSPNTKNSLSHIILLPSRGCDSTVGVSSSTVIPDGQMSASSGINPASEGRLHGASFWVPDATDTNPWLQIELTGERFISGIQTQGSTQNYVTLYEVEYSLDELLWGTIDIFNGNFDSDTVVTNMLDTPVRAAYIRVYPLNSVNDKAMRLELLGCSVGSQVAEHMDLEYTPNCDYSEYPGQCTQQWEFTVVLNVDEGSVTNNMPIDATGNFRFQYETYRCANASDVSVSTCEQLEIPDAIISHEITLQTTVQLTDSERDSPWLVVRKVYGDDPSVNLIGGYRPGVSHLETVSIDIEFYPEFLRTRLELELMLFMVCIGAEYEFDPDGCCSAPSTDLYTAYVNSEFSYTMSTGVKLESSHISTSSQELSYYYYHRSEETYKISFVNKALSARTQDYTITTVFRLVERLRKRREIPDEDLDLPSERERRDLEANAKNQQMSTVSLMGRGCPKTAIHDPENLECICLNGNVYSTEKYDCVVPEIELADPFEEAAVTNPTQDPDKTPQPAKPIEKDLGDSAAILITPAPMLLIAAAIIGLYYY